MLTTATSTSREVDQRRQRSRRARDPKSVSEGPGAGRSLAVARGLSNLH
jgi:hypothetical protein